MAQKEKVILVFDDDTRIKGIVEGFRPDRARFPLKEVDIGGQIVRIHDVDTYRVMAAFFVHDLALWRDEPVRVGRLKRARDEQPRRPARKVRVTFVWGEKMVARVEGYGPRKPWFLLYPSGTSGRAANIDRVFVTRQAIAAMEPVEDEEASR